jgi:hypothetical protein
VIQNNSQPKSSEEKMIVQNQAKDCDLTGKSFQSHLMESTGLLVTSQVPTANFLTFKGYYHRGL